MAKDALDGDRAVKTRNRFRVGEANQKASPTLSLVGVQRENMLHVDSFC